MGDDRDIVYILKNDIKSDELRYSLRSVCENFPYRKIVFVGGCPKDITPDLYIKHTQTGDSKWQRAVSSMRRAFIDDRISEDFFLFNDDFFILKPIDTSNFINYTNGTMNKRIMELEKNNRHSSYSNNLKSTQYFLRTHGYDTMSFALHIPMLVNKYNAMEMMNTYPDMPMFRCLYGNIYNVPYIHHQDVKVFSNEKLPKFEDYLSTSDESFQNGIVGEYIKDKFLNPCRYECYRDDPEPHVDEEE